MNYAKKHNFFEKLTELMGKCYLEDAQDPFLLIANTIYENRGINYLSKIKELEERISTYEKYLEIPDSIDKNKENISIDMKAAYESFGNSMREAEEPKNFIDIKSDSTIIKQDSINAPITVGTSADSSNDEPDTFNQLFICEDLPNVISNKTSEPSTFLLNDSSKIISNEILDLPFIIYKDAVIPAIVSQDEVEALIDETISTISVKTQETNEVVTANACTYTCKFNITTVAAEIQNAKMNAETLEIENALKALHSSHSSDYDYNINMNEPVVSKNKSDKVLSSICDDNFEPDYEDSE